MCRSEGGPGMMPGVLSNELTAGEVATRLGVKSGMVRRYALALEQVTGISLEVDPIKGRLYPPSAVELLEATRAYLLAHPGGSVEGAMRDVTGESEGEGTLPARVPGTVSPADLRAALRGALEEFTAPVLAALQEQEQRGQMLEQELSAVRGDLAALRVELQAARSSSERLEVMTHAALSDARPVQPAAPVSWLARFLGLKSRE
jgi:hypothetical protein